MIGCLVIHGFTGGPHELKPLTDYLREHTDWHISTPTLPGHGKELKLENISHKKWLSAAESTLQLLKQKYDKIYVIGFSMGGMIAAYLAAKYKVDKLVLLATARKYISFKQMSRDIAGVLRDGMKGKLDENRIYLHYKRKLGIVPLKANLEFMKLVRFTRKFLKEIKSPVLIAQGQMDSMVPYKTVYHLDKEIPSIEKEIVFFDQSRHLICLGNDKETLNQMVHQFLVKGTNRLKKKLRNE